MNVFDLIEKRLKDIEHLRGGHSETVKQRQADIERYRLCIEELNTEEASLLEAVRILNTDNDKKVSKFTSAVKKAGKTE